MAALTNLKILTSLSQIDCLLSFVLFIVENFVPYPDSKIHALILSTSILSVFMSLVELYCIGKKEYWQLLLTTLFRLGPIVSLSIFWMICSKRFVKLFTFFICLLSYSNFRDSQILLVASISLTYQIIKGKTQLYKTICITNIYYLL